MKDFVGNTIESGDEVVAPSPYFPTLWVRWRVFIAPGSSTLSMMYSGSKGKTVTKPLISNGLQVIKIIKQDQS